MSGSRTVIRMLVLVGAVAVAALVVGCSSDEPAVEAPTATAGEITIIDAAQAAALLDADDDVLVIDVRTVDEYRSGHVVGSQNIDASDPERWEMRTAALDKDRPTVVYCRTGRRSAEAAQRLVDAGFTQVYDLGGIEDFTDGDLPIDEA